jgi:hydrogenase maturation factor HypE
VQPRQTALLDKAEKEVEINFMITESDSTKAVENQSGKKPNIFQRMFQKLDDKMKEKAEKSECCCCCDDKKPQEDSEKCC